MNARLLSEAHGLRTFAVVFESGDEAAEGLLAFAHDQEISSAAFTGIGALRSVALGYFELERRDYKRIDIPEQVEVLTMAGNITLTADGRNVHAHLVVGRADGRAYGGHLLAAHVWPTLEVIVTETPAHLRRRRDPETGLALIAVADPSGCDIW